MDLLILVFLVMYSWHKNEKLEDMRHFLEVRDKFGESEGWVLGKIMVANDGKGFPKLRFGEKKKLLPFDLLLLKHCS